MAAQSAGRWSGVAGDRSRISVVHFRQHRGQLLGNIHAGGTAASCGCDTGLAADRELYLFYTPIIITNTQPSMIHAILKDRPTKLFLFFTAFFVANALIAECIGGKIFSLEKLLGLHPTQFSLFGQKGLSFNLTCG